MAHESQIPPPDAVPLSKLPNFDPRQFDPAQHRDRLMEVSQIIDSSNPDLSAFRAALTRVITDYPHLCHDGFVQQHRERWLA